MSGRHTTHCHGCQIPITDGYTHGCKTCYHRREGRLQRGELVTPNGYSGEGIDNRHPKGRIVAHP